MDKHLKDFAREFIFRELRKRFSDVNIKVSYNHILKINLEFDDNTYEYTYFYDEDIYNSYYNYLDSVVCETTRAITKIIINKYFKETYFIKSYLEDL